MVDPNIAPSNTGFPPYDYGVHEAAANTAAINELTLFTTPGSVPASGNVQSSIINTHDYEQAAFGFLAGGDLTASIQAYLDEAGTIPVGSPVTLSAAATSGVVQLPSGTIFRSVQVTLSNAGTSAVSLTKALLVVRARV